MIYKIGPARIGRALGLTSSQAVGVVDIPRDILDELNAHKAVAENVGDLMPQHEHDTILVQPDGELGYGLRPSVHLDVTVLNATGALNLDPPLLDYRRSLKSVFAPFALYVDHSHLSPMGNRLMAEKIAASLQTR